MPGSPLLVLQRGHKEISFGDLSSSFFCVCLFSFKKKLPFLFQEPWRCGEGVFTLFSLNSRSTKFRENLRAIFREY